MLQLSKVHQELQNKQQELSRFTLSITDELNIYESKLNTCIENYSSSEFNSKLSEIESLDETFLGAEFTEDFDTNGIVREFITQGSQSAWHSWKNNILENRLLFACDGSQFLPDKDLGLFFGAIQTASYMNFHNRDMKPIEDIHFEIIVPDEKQDDISFSEEIYTKRFIAEINSLIKILNNLEHGDTYEKRPLGIFDGSFTIPFEKNNTSKKACSVKINELLDISFKKKIPVVAYIDNTKSFNLIQSLRKINTESEEKAHITDAVLIKKYMKQWGDRSCYFTYYSGSENNNINNQVNNSLGFTYINNSSYRHKPCKLEIPHWVYQENLLEDTVNIILAESLVGNGYLHILEVADSRALLQHKDKQYICENILPKYKINLSKSSKIASKQQRRRGNIKY